MGTNMEVKQSNGEGNEGNDTQWRNNMCVGMYIDVKDTVGKPCISRILEVNDDSVYVCYLFWSITKWAEWLSRHSKRISQ